MFRPSFSALGRISAALSLFLIWLLPFCLRDHKIPVGTFWQEWTAAVLLTGALIAGLLAQRDHLAVRVPRAVLVFAALALIVLLQWTLGLLRFDANALVPLCYLGLAALAGVLGASLRTSVQSDGWASGIAAAAIIGGVFTVYAQIAQFVGFDRIQPFISPLPEGQHPFGNINQVNHTATYLGLALTAVVYLRTTAQLNPFSTGLLLAILATGLSLTGQRSAMVHAALPTLLTLLVWRRLPERRHIALITGLTGLLLFVLISLLLPGVEADASTPLAKLAHKAFYSDRLNFWEHALAMFRAQPWLGVGFDQFWPHFFEQLDVLTGGEAPNHPHNLFAMLLSETGLVGTALVSLPLLLWLWRQRGGAVAWTQWLGLTQLALLGFHSLIEYPLWYAYFLIIAAFWLGATDPAQWTVTVRRPRRLGLLLALILIVPLADVGVRYQQLRTQVWTMPHPGIVGLIGFQPPPSPAAGTLEHHWFFEREILFWQPDREPVRRDHLAQDIAQTELAMRVAPSSSLLFRLCVLRVLNGDVDTAVVLLRRAQQIYPGRYEQMRLALPLAAKHWPDAFGPALPRLMAP